MATAIMDQKIMSCHFTGKSPRSQNHWYECSSQEAKKTKSTGTTNATVGPSFRSRMWAGR